MTENQILAISSELVDQLCNREVKNRAVLHYQQLKQNSWHYQVLHNSLKIYIMNLPANIIKEDNQAPIRIANNPESHGKTSTLTYDTIFFVTKS